VINGNNNEDIFIDDQDKQAMVDILFEKITNNAYDFYAYCILDNRANLLIRPKDAGLSESMKKINMAYASYLNKSIHAAVTFSGSIQKHPHSLLHRYCFGYRLYSLQSFLEGLCGSRRIWISLLIGIMR
jgi:hypothetical protein